jgi:drug/metabolite transporter (DMT)-like permease
MFAAYLGHLAALGTSVSWSMTSIFFTLSGRKVGSPIVNRTRLLLAVGFAAITHRITQGSFFPVDAEPFRWGWLGLSGFIGYVLGDGALFQAFVMIGPRLSTLLMALVPVFSTILAWVLLDEVLAPLQLLGIGLSVSGVMVVVSERQPKLSQAVITRTPREYAFGLLFGLGGALGQALGLLASRMGLEGDFAALSGNMIRLITATVIIWLITAAQGKVRAGFQALRQNPDAFKAITAGAFAGPFIGVWFSLVAVQRAPLGVASTLMSLMPIILIPISRVLFGDRITPRAIVGTVIAFAGTVILFL